MMLANIAADGDSDGIHKWNENSPIYANLQSLKYIDLHTAAMDITYDFDAKHLCNCATCVQENRA